MGRRLKGSARKL